MGFEKAVEKNKNYENLLESKSGSDNFDTRGQNTLKSTTISKKVQTDRIKVKHVETGGFQDFDSSQQALKNNKTRKKLESFEFNNSMLMALERILTCSIFYAMVVKNNAIKRSNHALLNLDWRISLIVEFKNLRDQIPLQLSFNRMFNDLMLTISNHKEKNISSNNSKGLESLSMIALWNVKTPQAPLITLKMYDRLTSIDFSSQKPDTFAVATENGLIKIFSIKQNFTNSNKTQKDSRSSETCELSNLGSFKFELVQKNFNEISSAGTQMVLKKRT